MVDVEAQTIWRDIERAESPVVSKLRRIRHLLPSTVTSATIQPHRLKVNFETRPYEWAWCLYAAAIAAEIGKGEHIV